MAISRRNAIGPAGCGGLDEQLFPIGAVDDDLGAAIARALQCRREDCARYGAEYSWEAATDQFVAALTGALEAEAVAA
ncbi:hypothetical protein [Croceicoccus bisphenolivorans]|uniref:hypothetical protein n=1 Tax=Croceicoccus bisphenolivorans TaxID=1783232 RepID=UPI000830A3A5|nr:hypothetical protein [Croceicoccus bisphenolivorans]